MTLAHEAGRPTPFQQRRTVPRLAIGLVGDPVECGRFETPCPELGETGVTANAVSPGPTDTPILAESARLYGLPAAATFATQQPMRRLLDPTEVAAVLAFLASPASSAMTGAVVPADGGLAL